jgi:hypothetical protein
MQSTAEHWLVAALKPAQALLARSGRCLSGSDFFATDAAERVALSQRGKRLSADLCSWSFRKQLIPNIARRGRKSSTTRLAPDGLVDFLLVANCQGACCFSGEENCIAHFSA